MTSRVVDEPKSWAELLKRRESDRIQPPPPEFYVREKVVKHEEGGIFGVSPPEFPTRNDDEIEEYDVHFYQTTHIFDPEEPKVHHYKPRKDHGLNITAWKKNKRLEQRDAKPEKTTNFPRAQLESGKNFDIVTGVAHKSAFKSTVQDMLKNREKAKEISTKRKFDPIANMFPTGDLEQSRLQTETLQRTNTVQYYQNKMSSNERRAKNTLVNIITGEVFDKKAADSIQEFSHPNIERAKTAVERERTLVQKREEEWEFQHSRVGNRYNNGRMKEVRNWNIINGDKKTPGWDSSVKMKPSVWEWCNMERLETDNQN